MRRVIVWLLACLAVSASGCASFNVGADYSPIPDSHKGLAVFSLTGSGIGYFNIKFRRTSGGAAGFAPSGGTAGPKPDWIDPTGRLVAIDLDGGEYEFFAWEDHFGAGPTQSMATVVSDASGTMAIRARSSKTPFSVRFLVHSAAVTYIGNIHVALTGDGYTVRVSDQADRDLALFHQRYTRIKLEEVQRNLAVPGQ